MSQQTDANMSEGLYKIISSTGNPSSQKNDRFWQYLCWVYIHFIVIVNGFSFHEKEKNCLHNETSCFKYV